MFHTSCFTPHVSHLMFHTSCFTPDVLLRYNVTRSHMDELTSAIISLGYQFILIDCPAGIDVGFINAISPARCGLDPQILNVDIICGRGWVHLPP